MNTRYYEIGSIPDSMQLIEGVRRYESEIGHETMLELEFEHGGYVVSFHWLDNSRPTIVRCRVQLQDALYDMANALASRNVGVA